MPEVQGLQYAFCSQYFCCADLAGQLCRPCRPVVQTLQAKPWLCMCVPYLLDCKPQLIKLFFHCRNFVQLTIEGGLHFFH